MNSGYPYLLWQRILTGLSESKPRVFLILFLLTVAGVFRSAVATRLDSLDIDEFYHITAGVSYVRLGDYRLNPEHPPLVKLWTGASLTKSVFQLPPLVRMADKLGERHYAAGAVYLVNDPDRVQHRARIAMFLLNSILLLGFGIAVAHVLHPGLAVGAVAFLVIDPTVAAHLPLVLTDLPVALLCSIAFLLGFHAFRNWRISSLLLAGLALGLALGVKHSALAVGVAVFVMGVGMALFHSNSWQRRFRRVLAPFLVILVAWTVLWGLYRFRFNESPVGIDTFNRPLAAKIEDLNSPLMRKSISMAEKYHLLPRSYLWGFADIVRAGIEGRIFAISFWDHYYIRKTPFYFFPAVVFFKLPLGLTVLVAFGLGLLITRKIPPERKMGVAALGAFGFYIFIVLASANSSYAGVRHALPVFPVLAVLGASALLFAAESQARAARIVCAIAAIGALASALPVVRPWEYYNELAGGSANAYHHFNDEGLETGQRVREYAEFYHRELESKGILPYTEYWLFFSDEEFERRGIKTLQSTWDKDESLDPGSRITGTLVMNAKWIRLDPWADYTALRVVQPTERIGNLLIYRGSFDLPDAYAWRLIFRGWTLTYSDKPDPAKAEDYFRRAAALAPKIFFSNLELGNLLSQRGARAEAIKAYEEARRYSPPQEPVSKRLAEQIERISREDPASVPPVRDPYLE